MLGMLVGKNAFLSSLFIPASGILHSFFEGMRTIGAGYLPCVLMVLAGSLVAPPPKDESEVEVEADGTWQKVKKDFGIGPQVEIFLNYFETMFPLFFYNIHICHRL